VEDAPTGERTPCVLPAQTYNLTLKARDTDFRIACARNSATCGDIPKDERGGISALGASRHR
jgi:hypothetical protein